MSRKLKDNELAVDANELREVAAMVREAIKICKTTGADRVARALLGKAKSSIDLMLILGDEDCPF
tara:strand:- start:2120 stop:2314 length:195 start_codon:yes stop_codon:yes gene_type:complete